MCVPYKAPFLLSESGTRRTRTSTDDHYLLRSRASWHGSQHGNNTPVYSAVAQLHTRLRPPHNIPRLSAAGCRVPVSPPRGCCSDSELVAMRSRRAVVKRCCQQSAVSAPLGESAKSSGQGSERRQPVEQSTTPFAYLRAMASTPYSACILGVLVDALIQHGLRGAC
jgi:hypothetical protein